MEISKGITQIIKNRLNDILNLRDKFELKPDDSYVSKGDLLVQDLVYNYFIQALPDHLLISEEMAPFENVEWNSKGNYVILDPIDGTENFISGLKEWGVGISIFTNGKHVESCIYLPELNELLISGQSLVKFKSRIQGLSSSLTKDDLINLPKIGSEFRIIGCSMYNMLSAVKGSFISFENVKGVSCWDILPGLNLALEHGTLAWVDDEPYHGELLFPTKKYKIRLLNSH